MKKLITFLLFFFVSISSAYAETVSLSTYYPAPFGAYDRLRLVPRASAPPCTAALEGLLYYDSSLQLLMICKDPGVGFEMIAGVWTQNNIDASNAEVYLTEPTRAVNVGIGTTNPVADLHVAESGEVLIESNGDTGLTFISTGGGDDDFELRLADSTYFTLNADNNSDGTFETNVMSFGSDGSVGIGTSSPSENLTIDGGGGDVVQRITIESGGSGSAWLRLTETQFRGGFLRYDNSTNDFHIGVHDDNNTSVSDDDVAISIDRGSGEVTIGGSSGGSSEALNINGSINLNDGTSNWGKLMVQYDSGGYYAVYAP